MFSDKQEINVYFSEENINFLEINYAVFYDTENLSNDEYAEKIDEYYDKFENDTLLIGELLGKPLFNGEAFAVGFPEDQDANWLALWNINNARLMIQHKNEARELPIRLALVIAPN